VSKPNPPHSQDQWRAIAAFAKRMATDHLFASEMMSSDDGERKVELARQAVAEVASGKSLEVKIGPGFIVCFCAEGDCICLYIL
jgi:hypothetical protein